MRRLVSAVDVGDAIFAVLGEHVDEQQTVELTSTRAFYSAAVTIMRALSIQIVPDAGRTGVPERVGDVRRATLNHFGAVVVGENGQADCLLVTRKSGVVETACITALRCCA